MKIRPLFFALGLAALPVLPSCSKKEETPAAQTSPAPGPATSAPAPYTSVADAPEAERKALEEFAILLEKNLKNKDVAAVKNAFYIDGMIERVSEGVEASGTKMAEFKGGMAEGFRENLDFIAKSWSGQDVTYKHLVVHQGQLKPRFRIIAENAGITLMDFTVVKTPGGQLGIVDFYNQALGSGMVEQSRQAAIPMLAELDKNFLQRVIGKPGTAVKDMELFGDMSTQFRKGDFKGAAATYQQLPPALRDSLSATAMHLAALQQGGDDEGYKTALKKAATTHKSANFQFMLVDLYFLEKNYDKAIECLDIFMAAVEKDASLLALKALLQTTKGDTAAGAATLKEGLALEPGCIYAHSNGVDVLLAAKDYPAVAESMKVLEERGNFAFKGKLTDPIWADFVKAPESEPWR